MSRRNSRAHGAQRPKCSLTLKSAWRVCLHRSTRAALLSATLTFSNQAFGKSEGIAFVILPNNANSCIKVAISNTVIVTSKCSDITVLYCFFGESGPVWACRANKIGAKPSATKFPLSRDTIRQVYVGACKPNAIECVKRQKWLLAAVDGRQNPYLAVQLMEPGSDGEPVDPSIVVRRRHARG